MRENIHKHALRYTGDEYTPNTASELYTPDSEAVFGVYSSPV